MKRFFAFILAAMLLLCACGKQDGAQSDDTTVPENGTVYEHDPQDPDKTTAVITYENGVEVSRDNYEYNEDGNISAVITVKNGETVQKTGYVYEAGKISQSTKEFKDEGITCKEISDFSEDGQLQSTVYYEDDVLQGKELYSYDEMGQMIRTDREDAEGNSNGYTLYTYDAGGRIVKAENYLFDCLDTYYEYTYKDGTIDSVKKYDGNGNLLSE